MTEIQPADVFELLRKLRMDLTNAQGKLSDTMRCLAALNFEETHQPLEPAEKLRREIRNGSINDDHDLLVALRTVELEPAAVDSLRASLKGRATTPAPDQRSAA